MPPVLSEELEKLVLAMVRPLPDLVRWQLVCKRWRRLLTDPTWLPPTVLDMDVLRPLSAAQYAALLQRWRGTTVLQMTLQATIPHEQQWHMDIGRHLDRLCELRLRTTSTKAVLAILTHCRQLHTLELLECRSLVLPKLPEPVALAVLQMHTATRLMPTTLANFLRKCPELKSLTITAGSGISSSMLTTLVQGCAKMERLIFSQCGAIAAPDVAAFLTAFGHQLQWLDLSHSSTGPSISLNAPIALSCLEGLVLDSIRVQDGFLRCLDCPVLCVLSLQNCRNLSDEGLRAFIAAGPRPTLRAIDLKNTNISETTVTTIERMCRNLTHLGVESCRSLPRAMRQRHALQAHLHPSAYERVLVAANTISNLNVRERRLLGVESGDDDDYVGPGDDEDAPLVLQYPALHRSKRSRHR